MKKIAIVEDDETIRKELGELLKNANYDVYCVEDFSHALESLLASNSDLVLLDINIPCLNGKEVLKRIREKSNIPVIMVTSNNNELDEALSITFGADDYITKPYNPNILILRIQSVLKRCNNTEQNKMYRGFFINKSRCELESGDKVIELTKNEMIIFMCLFDNLGKIVSRDEIMTTLWNNDEYINDNALTVNISRLRSKLSDASLTDAIETKKGLGYILL